MKAERALIMTDCDEFSQLIFRKIWDAVQRDVLIQWLMQTPSRLKGSLC